MHLCCFFFCSQTRSQIHLTTLHGVYAIVTMKNRQSSHTVALLPARRNFQLEFQISYVACASSSISPTLLTPFIIYDDVGYIVHNGCTVYVAIERRTVAGLFLNIDRNLTYINTIPDYPLLVRFRFTKKKSSIREQYYSNVNAVYI